MVKRKKELITKENKPDGKVKELEQLIFSIKFYPVAVDKKTKGQAVEKIIKEYKDGDENIKQLILYMIHENVSQAAETKNMYNFDFFKRKFPNLEPSQNRLNVYKAMFHYNHSLEGLCELIKVLGKLEGDDAAKVLTYHFTYLSSSDSDVYNILRNAIIEALGESQSIYAFNSLMTYAQYSDNERLLQRLGMSLSKWSDKIENLQVPQEKKEEVIKALSELVIPVIGDTHYR